ncbi:GGDEF domain-containing protein [Thalassiella azotivora]
MEAEVPVARGAVSRWLCPTEMQRQRFLDMNDRVRTARMIQGAAMSLACLVASYWYGWPVAATVAAAVTTLVGLDVAYRLVRRPEIASFASITVLEVILLVTATFSGGAHSPLLPFTAIPTIMLAARFRPAVVAWGVGGSLVGTAGALVTAARWLPAAPEVPWVVPVVAYLAVLASVVAASTILLQAELQSRGDAVVDQLTGLFNRKALHGRYVEAMAQARAIGASVSLVICDLDHFKRVNDEHGHDRGDVVLREAAYRMRRTLRVFDLVYRLGGEEFLVLLPGQDEHAAALVAERLVQDLGAEPLAGLAVTMSAGVACTHGEDLSFEDLLRRADLALYAAKRGGRNRVERASDVPVHLPV